MSVALFQNGYGTDWKDIRLDRYSAFYPNMSDYHMHEYFEISLILSGNVHVLLADQAVHSTEAKLVLLRPFTPHFIYCEPDRLYSRRNVLFAPDFLSDSLTEWQSLNHVFRENGAILTLSDKQTEQYLALVEQIENENSILRKRLLLLYFLSLISDAMRESGEVLSLPAYISGALSYISTHYSEHIIAGELADRLGVGRTTLMTGFKKYTGTTLNECLARCRLKHAIALLREGQTEQQVAETCGFGDPCALIRSFKRFFGKTPRQYINEK